MAVHENIDLSQNLLWGKVFVSLRRRSILVCDFSNEDLSAAKFIKISMQSQLIYRQHSTTKLNKNSSLPAIFHQTASFTLCLGNISLNRTRCAITHFIDIPWLLVVTCSCIDFLCANVFFFDIMDIRGKGRKKCVHTLIFLCAS